jgi:hypothetical protein
MPWWLSKILQVTKQFYHNLWQTTILQIRPLIAHHRPWPETTETQSAIAFARVVTVTAARRTEYWIKPGSGRMPGLQRRARMSRRRTGPISYRRLSKHSPWCLALMMIGKMLRRAPPVVTTSWMLDCWRVGVYWLTWTTRRKAKEPIDNWYRNDYHSEAMSKIPNISTLTNR